MQHRRNPASYFSRIPVSLLNAAGVILKHAFMRQKK
jgi:hypothetical protein